MIRAKRSVGVAGRWLAAPAALAIVVLSGACASGGVSTQMANIWREDMGRVTRATLETGLEKIVSKHALQIARTQEASRELYYETIWMDREVVADEEIRGVTHARNRIVLKGRATSATMAGGSVYRITWELENEVSSADAEGWHPDIVPDEVVELFRPVYSDLMLEVRTGLIR